MRKLLCMLAVGSFLLPIQSASADEVNPKHIPKDATWFAHINFEASEDSKLLEKLTEGEESGKPSRLHEWLSTRYGIEADELDGLTLYSPTSDQDESVALLYGGIYERKLLETVKRHTTINSNEVGDVTYHSWTVREGDDQPNVNRTAATRRSDSKASETTDANHQVNANRTNQQRVEERTVTAAFLDDVSIFTNDRDAAEQAVTSIQNQQGLPADKLVKIDQKLPGEILFQAVVLNVDEAKAKPQTALSDQDSSWAVMENLDTISVAMGEMQEDKAFVAVEARAKSETAAEKVGDILDGLRALASLNTSDDANSGFDLGALKPDVQQDGRFLRMGWTIEVDQMVEMLESQVEKNSERTARTKPTVRNATR